MRKRPEWVGETDDTPLPKSVYIRLYREQDGKCAKCTRKLTPGNIEREHLKPLSMGGENRESNIELWCANPCSKSKTALEAAPRAKADQVLAKTMGFKSPGRKPVVPGSKNSPWKKQWNKHTQRWETVKRTS